MSVRDVVREIAKDEIFYFHSGGGVTVSGGEPLRQAEFVAEVLRECRLRGIHTAMETSFHAGWGAVAKVLPLLSVLYVDLKQMEPAAHGQWVGADNALTLENLRKADQADWPLEIIVRIPMVPGANDSDANLRATAEFCRGLRKLKEIELLPYHRLGTETYRHLDRDYPLQDVVAPTRERMQERAAFLVQQNPGAPVRVGG
jgi:pyruvate formate lyase activating enzyme